MSNEEYAPTKPEPKPNCLRAACITCLVLVLLFAALTFYTFSILRKHPAVRRSISEVKAISQCVNQLIEINGALKRYESRTGNYPESLDKLYPRFLEDRSALHCPSDLSPKSQISYEYFMPKKGSPGKTLVLRCTHHRIFEKQEPITIKVYLNGSVETIGPTVSSLKNIRPALPRNKPRPSG